MYYFPRHRLGFFHIPKTGGTSFYEFLNRTMRGRGDPEQEITRDLYHEPIASKRDVLGAAVFADSTFVTTIRNPYAVVVSLYFWCKRKVDEKHPDLETYPTTEAIAAMDFPSYVRFYVDNEQSFDHYLLLDGEVPANLRVLRLEDVSAEADRVLNGELGLGVDTRIGVSRTTLTQHAPALSYLTLADIDLINAKHAWEFDRYYAGQRLGVPPLRELHGAALAMLATLRVAGGLLAAQAQRLNDAMLAGEDPVPAMVALLVEALGAGVEIRRELFAHAAPVEVRDLRLVQVCNSARGCVPALAEVLPPLRSVPRLQEGDLGPLAGPLVALTALSDAELRFNEAPTVEDIDAAGERAAVALAAWLRAYAPLPAQVLAKTAAVLFQRAESALWYWTFFAEVTPFERDERYGLLDPKRFRALHRAWMRVVADIATHLLDSAPGAPVAATAAGLLADSCMRLAAPERAVPVLEAAWQATHDRAVALALERCHLLADAPRAAEQVRARAGLQAGTAHRLREFPDWARCEQLALVTRAIDPAESGAFELVHDDAVVQRRIHEVPAQALQTVHARDLRLRGIHLLAGPGGTILHPRAYVQTGEFPYHAPQVLARVTGRDVAVMLAAHADWQRVDEPVFVLDHMVIAHGNYYHWMLETVSRLAWADQAGLIGARRVLVPADTRPWMQQALELAGIGADRQRLYRANDDLHLADACVLSSVDFSSRSLLAAMRERFWRAAGAAPATASGQGRWLFLTRRGNDNRQLLNLDVVEQLAAQAGFEIVVPETLDVAAQVRLFASAAGIAGLEGAAFTNQVFAPSGVRILGMSGEDDNEPTFINLSILLDQPRRCLLGGTPRAYLQAGQHAAAYRMRPDVVQAGLAWVKGGAAC